MIRICLLGINLFKHDRIIVDSKMYGFPEYNLLMEIKAQPQNFNKEQLVEIANVYFRRLLHTMDSSSVKHEFNKNLAANLILEIKYGMRD